MVSPSGGVPERDPDWFFVAKEVCGGGTPGLGLFLEVLGFIGGVGVGDKSRGARGDDKDGGLALGSALHPCGGLGTLL